MTLPKFEDVQRIRLRLPNGKVLSIVQGPGVYSGEGTVEVMVYDANGEGVGDPKGYVNADKLAKLIRKESKTARVSITAYTARQSKTGKEVLMIKFPDNPDRGEEFSYICPISGCSWVTYRYIDFGDGFGPFWLMVRYE